MITSESLNELSAALAKAQGQMSGAVKDSANPFFKSKYADLASVWDACRDALSKNGLALVQSPEVDGLRVSVDTLLTHTSGQWIKGTVSVSAKEDSPQAVGSCITYLRRYALQSFVGVAPEDDDAEAAHGRGKDQKWTGAILDGPATARTAAAAAYVEASRALTTPLPVGYHYIHGYQKSGEWHEFSLLDWDQQGGSYKFSTKRDAIGDVVRQAYETGLPIKVTDYTPNAKRKGEGYVNKLETYKPPPSDSELDAELAKQTTARQAGEMF